MNKYSEILAGLSNDSTYAEAYTKLNDMLKVDMEELERLNVENSELKTSLANTKLELSKALIRNTSGNIGTEDDGETEEEKEKREAHNILFGVRE